MQVYSVTQIRPRADIVHFKDSICLLFTYSY